MHVVIPEKVTFTNAPSPQEFNEGDNAILICDVISSPPPTVFWKYKGAKIQMEKDGKRSVDPSDHISISFDYKIFCVSCCV